MIIHKIPKPITLIGENSNKCMCFASCNFIYISKFFNKRRFLINKNVKDFFKYYLNNFQKLKSEIINIKENNEFASCYTALFGNLNLINLYNKSWFNIKINFNKEFFDHLLIFHIKRKFFKYVETKNIDEFDKELSNKMTEDAHKAYSKNDFKFFGTLVDSYWRLKLNSNPNFANQYIYNLYAGCRLAGAWGGKLDENTMILLAPPEKHDNILNIMKDNVRLKSSLNTTGIITEELFGGNSNCCK